MKKTIPFLLQNFLMALAMTLTIAILHHQPLNGALMVDLLIAWAFSMLYSALIPAQRIGPWFAAKCKASFGLPSLLVGTLLNNLIFTTLMSLSMTAIHTGLTPALPGAWLSIYPWALVAGYVAAVIAQLLCERITTKLTSKEVTL